MREEMRKMGLPEPEFVSLRGDFKVIFRKEKTKNSEQNKNREFTEKFTEKFTENFTQSEQKILNELIDNPYITQARLSELLGISKRSIIKNMKNLKDRGIIYRVGSDRKGYWKIK